MKKECIKKAYSADEADKEIIQLEKDFPQCRWWAEKCAYCGQYHLHREGTSYVREW